MEFLFNSLSNLLTSIGGQASTYCALVFFEPEVPKSLREE